MTGLSITAAVFVLLNAVFGSVVISLPYMTKLAGGIVPFIILQIVVTLLFAATLIVLGKGEKICV